MPLSAIIEDQRIIGPDLSQEEWNNLKQRHRSGLPVLMGCCSAPGHLRTSKKGLQHFYHASKSADCNWEHESLAHLEIKNEIYQICKAAGWEASVEFISADNDWRADVYTQKNDKTIVFEIQLTRIPLETLKERDAKYRKLGFESYWILKNKASYQLNDSRGFRGDLGELPYVDYYFSNEPGKENPNEYQFFIPKDIIAIDIILERRLLRMDYGKNITLNEWVNSILNGEYQLKLLKICEEYEYLSNLRKIAKPILEEVESSQTRIIELIRELKRQYAIFKNNSFTDSPYIRENFHICYSIKKEMTKYFYGTVRSKKLGWKWLKSEYYSHIEHVLHLKTIDQLFSIEKLSKEAIPLIDKFETQLETLASNIQENKIIEKKTDFKEKIHQSGPSKNHFPIKSRRVFVPNSITLNPNEAISNSSQDRIKPLQEFVQFEPKLDLSTNWLEDSDGIHYQVVPGLPGGMVLKAATEFEKKGFGRIIKKK